MRISKISKVPGAHRIIDIEVEYDHSFVVAGCILHNSNICRSRDGMKIMWDDAVKPKPPFHYNCRTCTAPLLSEEFDIFNEGAERASKGADGGKPVSADLTYYSWLQQQTAAFQDEVLGKTKGLIFRNSGIDAETFRKISVDHLGRPLTLDELKEADERIAAYMDK